MQLFVSCWSQASQKSEAMTSCFSGHLCQPTECFPRCFLSQFNVLTVCGVTCVHTHLKQMLLCRQDWGQPASLADQKPEQQMRALHPCDLRHTVWLGIWHDRQVLPHLLPQASCAAAGRDQLCICRHAAVCGCHVLSGVPSCTSVW